MDFAQFVGEMRLDPARAIPTIEAIYATGYSLLEQHRFAEAAKVFRVMLHAAPRDERAWLGLGECHANVDQTSIALELFGTGAALAAPSARCELARARLLRTLGRDDEADAAHERAEDILEQSDDASLIDLLRSQRRRPS